MRTDEEIDKDMIAWANALAERKSSTGGSGGVLDRNVTELVSRPFPKRADVDIAWVGTGEISVAYRSSRVERTKTGAYYEGSPDYKVWLKADFNTGGFGSLIVERVLKVPDTDPCNTWTIDGYTDYTTTNNCYTELEYCAGTLIREYHNPNGCTHISAVGLNSKTNEYTTTLLISRALAKISFPPNFDCAIPPPLPPNQSCLHQSRRDLSPDSVTIHITRVQFKFGGSSGPIYWTEQTTPDVGSPTTENKSGTFDTTYTLMEPAVNGTKIIISYHV